MEFSSCGSSFAVLVRFGCISSILHRISGLLKGGQISCHSIKSYASVMVLA